MAFEPVKPPYKTRQVLICTNVRDPSLHRASCGAHGSMAMRDRLKAAVKEAGRKGDVMVSATSCLGFCPTTGCTVGIMPDNEWMLMQVNEEDERELRERILRA